MIDYLEAIIAYLRADTDLAALVSTRIAAKHKYGDGWTLGDSGMAVRADGGEPQHYVPIQMPRLEVRMYGNGTLAVMQVYQKLAALCRNTDRNVVALTGDDALVHWLLPASGLSMLFDDETGMDMGMVFMNACVGELGI